MIKSIPEPLKLGDTIGIIAPAGQIRNHDAFERGVAILRDMGFDVKFPRNLWPGSSYLADCDINRQRELTEFFVNPEVKALIALRGGYGCLRILADIDLSLIARNPKFLIGFSDISILLNYINFHSGLVTIHGPVVTSLAKSTPESLERLFQSLTGRLLSPIEIPDLEIVQGGTPIPGPIRGGNLTSLVSLVGTQLDFDWANSILFFEDVNEPLYKVDRMLSQLQLSGKLNKINGVLLGDFTHGSHQDGIERMRYREAIWKMVQSTCSGLPIPIWANFPSGHGKRNLAFPLGINVELDENKSRVNFLLA